MKTFIATLAATALLSTATIAADAEFHPSTYTTYKKHGPYSGSVKILEKLPAPGQYTEIGIVRVPTSKVASSSQAIRLLKAKAAQHGGNALKLEDDAVIFANGGTTDRGTRPQHATAIAVISN